MKTLAFVAIAALFLSVFACESNVKEEESTCLPVNMTVTLVQGSMTSKIIADFHYLPESDLIDHITWSTHQTHFFEYDASGRLKVVRVMKVDYKVQEERWFVYNGSLVERVDLVTRNLDYVYLEPVDSTYTGFIEMEYNGNQVVRESEYEMKANGHKEVLVRNASYEYDYQGNLTGSTVTDVKSGDSEHQNMSYDQSKHPFGGLHYYFMGDSYVNNMISKTLVESEFEYTYDIQLNEYGYPDQIFEKLGSANTRIFRYSYSIK